jgi:hypothetical protein
MRDRSEKVMFAAVVDACLEGVKEGGIQDRDSIWSSISKIEIVAQLT